MADVSVVMPAYQAAATIVRALRSIAAQTVIPAEIIVVDDGSTDDTHAAALSCRAALGETRLRVFRQARSGAGAARNRALVEGQSRYVAFLDADDAWLPAKLERSLAVLEAGSYAMVAHDIIEITRDGEKHVDCRARWLRDPTDTFRTLYVRGYISSSTVVVRRDVIRAAGGFDPGLRSGQDYDLWLAILGDPANRFELFGEAHLRYYLHDAGITGQVEARRRCNLTILRRHAGRLRGCSGSAAGPVLARTAAVHLEAMQGHRAQGRPLAALGCVVRLPWESLRSCLAILRAAPARPDFLATVAPAPEVTA